MDDLLNAVKTCFRKYVDFNGRAAKPEFWWFFLAGLLAGVVASFFGRFVNNIVSLIFLLPSLAVGARRLHDIGKSGWFQLLWLVPIIGWGIMIYWLVQPTGPANQYGGGPAEPAAVDVVPGQQ